MERCEIFLSSRLAFGGVDNSVCFRGDFVGDFALVFDLEPGEEFRRWLGEV